MIDFYQTVVEAGQDIYDVCIQEYGSIDPIDTFLLDNGLVLDSDLVTGQKLKIRKDPSAELVPDRTAMLLLRNNQIRIVNTNPTTVEPSLVRVHDSDHDQDHN